MGQNEFVEACPSGQGSLVDALNQLRSAQATIDAWNAVSVLSARLQHVIDDLEIVIAAEEGGEFTVNF